MGHPLSLRAGEGSHALPAACGPRRLAGAWRRLRPLRLGLAWCGLCAGSALLWHAAGPPLLLNLSASVPRGIYRLTPLTTLTRGMLVVFPPPADVAALLVRRGYLGIVSIIWGTVRMCSKRLRS